MNLKKNEPYFVEDFELIKISELLTVYLINNQLVCKNFQFPFIASGGEKCFLQVSCNIIRQFEFDSFIFDDIEVNKNDEKT